MVFSGNTKTYTMSTLINLADLLQHEIDDLYSAEEQIIAALPEVIEKATDPALKDALREHLNVTKKQIKRLEKVRTMMGKKPVQSTESKSFFARLFGSGAHKCKGIEGLIDEANKMMKEELTPQVKDAAIIASIQKIEHYEISGYGTAKAFALEIKMPAIANLLNETLIEEYFADDSLTALAVKKGVNQKAEIATEKSLPKNKKPAATSSAKKKITKPSKSESQNNPSEVHSSGNKTSQMRAVTSLSKSQSQNNNQEEIQDKKRPQQSVTNKQPQVNTNNKKNTQAGNTVAQKPQGNGQPNRGVNAKKAGNNNRQAINKSTGKAAPSVVSSNQSSKASKASPQKKSQPGRKPSPAGKTNK